MTSEAVQKEPQDTPTDDGRAFVAAFFKEIKTVLSKDEVERGFWVTKKGVFVRTETTEKVIAAFCRWFQEKIGNDIAYSLEKAEKKLLADLGRKEFYLVIGSSVVVGNLIESGDAALRGVGIRLYEGIPLDTASNIHHTDPIFTTSNSLRAHLGKSGYGALFQGKHGELFLPFDLLVPLREYFLRSGDLKRYIHANNLRSLISSLAVSLDFAKVIGKKDLILLPERVLKNQSAYLLVVGGLIFVVEEGKIVDFFSAKGKEKESLIRQELYDLCKSDRRRMRGASMNLVKESFLASMNIAGIGHKFGVSVVLSFEEAIADHREQNRGKLIGRLPAHYTIEEVVSELVFLLKAATPILPDKVPSFLREDFHPDARILVSNGEWYFAVDKTHMVRQVVYSFKSPKKVTPMPKADDKRAQDPASNMKRSVSISDQ